MDKAIFLWMRHFIESETDQGSLQLGGHGGPPNHFEILPNQKVTKFISLLYIIIRVMWLAPKVILSNQVDNKIFVIITKPSIMLERTLKQTRINSYTLLSSWVERVLVPTVGLVFSSVAAVTDFCCWAACCFCIFSSEGNFWMYLENSGILL